MFRLVLLLLLLPIHSLSSAGVAAQPSTISEKSTQSVIVVQFLNDEHKPLPHASATLIEREGDSFVKAHFRERPLNKDGSLSLPSTFLNLPDGSFLAISTRDEYYVDSFEITTLRKIKISGNKLVLAVPKTGLISATILTTRTGPVEPLVVSVSKLDANGLYADFSGIGIWLSNNYAFSIPGLPTGTYMIKVKKNYEAFIVFYQKDGIKVNAGNTTELGGLDLKVK